MKFSKLKISEAITDGNGLKKIDLSKKTLGTTVALVGKNGAGKSRILRCVENVISQMTKQDLFNGFIDKLPIEFLPSNLESAWINERRWYLEIKVPNKDTFQKQNPISIETSEIILANLKKIAGLFIKVVDNDDLQNIKSEIDNSFTFEDLLTNVHFDKILTRSANASESKNQQQIINSINEFKFLNTQKTIEYFNRITNKILVDEFDLYYRNRNDLDKINEKIAKTESHKTFSKFQEYVKRFLGKEFSYQRIPQGNLISSCLYFDNQPFSIADFSPGQKTLFAYAILFFFMEMNSKANIKDSIIIIDEPEKHLHPEAQIKLINALKEIVADSGQLWIATHSIHILSHLEPDEIFMVKDGEIIPPSRTTPGNSLSDLMGLDEHIEELAAFINSTSEWAYANFMRQCFKVPEVIFEHTPNDPQYLLFKKFIEEFKSLSLLDYGAGKGRIGYTIEEDEELKQKIVYSAYEPNAEYSEELKQIPEIKNIYQNKEEISENSFDCIVLCNVLHEIHPKQWLENFNDIKRILKPNGYLLIIEDKFLPKGETAHECGYVILGSSELNILFNPNGDILELKLEDKRYKKRIVFCAVKKEQMNATNDSVKKAIKELEKASYIKVKELRNNPQNDVGHGRMYANQTQLYINSQLALEELDKVES